MDGIPSTRSEAHSPQRGDTIGRFVIIGLVGRGGMGEVYAAYDPELDRKVAVKVLRSRGDASDDARLRLLREAQATARLSHPNVVVVYDVGTVGDGVFIAMEFVEGNTVGYWMQAAARSPREVLEIFVQAGRGLASAHEAGLVHRDFKPDNVMISRDGQVRVMDFGLARTLGESDGAAPAPTKAPIVAAPADGEMMATRDLNAAAAAPAMTSSGKYLQVKLTQTGAQTGTPAYMAPEQFLASATDARTDQFSFCVALYEALFGQRPFAGDTFSELMGNVLMEAVRPPPEGSRVPSWMRKIVLRGLRLDPALRWPSMADLLAALQDDPAARRRRWMAWALVPVLVAAGGLTATRLGRQQNNLCAAGPARLAGVWQLGSGAPARASIHGAFVASGKSYAEQAFAGATRLLDAYAGRWIAAYQDTCEATHVRGEQSPEVLDLRMACLQERVTNLRAVVEVFTRADPAVVENAVSAAAALPPVDACADVKSLRAVVPPPSDPQRRKVVDGLRGELATLIAERDAGHCKAAEAKSADLIQRVRDAGYLPLLAETLNAAGVMGNNCSDARESLKRFKEAFLAATASHHDQAAAEAAAMIPGTAVNRLGDVKLAREWLDLAGAAVQRVGANPRLEAWLLVAESFVRSGEGAYEGAIAAARRSLSIREALYGPEHIETILALANVGLFLQEAGRNAEALDVDAQARERTARALGADHPQGAMISNNEGEVLALLGRHAEAKAAFERAVDVWTRSGTDRVILSYGLTGMGKALVRLGRNQEAVKVLEQALESRAAGRVDPAVRAETQLALTEAQQALSRGQRSGTGGGSKAP